MQRLLITGASGTLGRNVARIAQQQGWEVSGTYYTAPPPLPGQWRWLDMGDRDAVMAVIRQSQPTAIVHTAFLQRGPAMWATNADGSAFVALAAQALGARLIHVSSDAIFDGTSSPYTEAARPNPTYSLRRRQGCGRDGSERHRPAGCHCPHLADYQSRTA